MTKQCSGDLECDFDKIMVRIQEDLLNLAAPRNY
jgi:hypothetical protein